MEKTLADKVSSAKSANVFTTKVLCYTVLPFVYTSFCVYRQLQNSKITHISGIFRL